MICSICNKLFNSVSSFSHHLRSHKLSPKIYYDKYLKKPNEGICPVCGKETTFRGLSVGYLECCSSKCSNNYNIQKIKSSKLANHGSETYNNSEKAKQTCIEKYGVDNVLKIKEIHDKGIIAAQSDVAKEKRNVTCLSKYGAINPYASEAIKEKIKATNLKRYGVKYTSQNKDIMRKIQTTTMKRYKVKCNLNLPEVIRRAQSFDANVKRINTRKHKDYFRHSSYEQLFKKKLEESGLKEDIDFITQYYSKEYPFACDFYIVASNTYIEIQGFWKHGGRPYIGSDEDNKLVELWMSKSKDKPDYTHAIYIWTKSDVLKRQTAKQNHLNYIELWTKDDINNYFKEEN